MKVVFNLLDFNPGAMGRIETWSLKELRFEGMPPDGEAEQQLL